MLGRGAVLIVAAIVLTAAPAAQAAPVSATLTSSNGEGRFDDTLSCAAAGDGPSWRYGYSGATATAGPLNGLWTGSVEVHDAGSGAAFVPAGDGRLALTADRGGTAHLEFGQGGCGDAALTLATDANDEPVASGTLPITATGGNGTLRGFTGSGSATFSFGLGAGADNPASISLTGNFTVTQPGLGVTDAVPRYANLVDYLARRLTVDVLVSAAPAGGDGYGVRLTAAKLKTTAASAGVPAALGRIDAGGGRWTTLKFNGINPLSSYVLTTTVAGTDSLDAPVAPVTQTRTIKTPLTF